MATKDDSYYRLFYKGASSKKYFFKMHPATKELYNHNEIDEDLMDLIMALLDPTPDLRPQSIDLIR